MRRPTRSAAPDRGYGVDDFQHQARAVFQRSAIRAGALVGAVAQELVEQVAIGAVDFHAVEAGGDRVFRGLAEAGDDARDLVIAQFARDDIGLFALGRVDFVALDGKGARGDRLGATVEQGMAGAAAVPELQEDPSAGRVDGVGDEFPAGDLGVRVDAGLHPEGGVAFHRHGRLGDDETGAARAGHSTPP